MKLARKTGFIILYALSVYVSAQLKSPSATPRWPAGLYALPMADSGCPDSDRFTWYTGKRTEEMENDHNRNSHSTNFHLRNTVGNPEITRYFCVKNTTTGDSLRPHWPSGKYCIFKKGDTCPTGFLAGYVTWDDNNMKNGSNQNRHYGELPAGVYNQDTTMYVCCKDSGSALKRVVLPVVKPFYLLAFKSTDCQEVQGAVFSLEYIVFDTENTNNHDNTMFPFPFGADSVDPKIYYCYYRECKWNLSNITGVFSSPYFPKNYHDYHDCLWNITVPDGHVIQLKFDVFELESSPLSCSPCNCDYVDVNEETPSGGIRSIGRYCMTFTPLPVIQSTSNKMIIKFHSDHAISAKGFKASYTAVQINERIPTTTVSLSTFFKNSPGTTKRTTIERSTSKATQRPTIIQRSLPTITTSSQTTNGTAIEDKKTQQPESSIEPFTEGKISTRQGLSSFEDLVFVGYKPTVTPHLVTESSEDDEESQDPLILSLKYSIIGVGSFVIVVLAAMFVACKLCNPRRSSRMKSHSHDRQRYSVTYTTVLDSVGSSPPSSPLTICDESEMEDIFLGGKESENPLYDKRKNDEKDRTNERDLKESRNPLYESCCASVESKKKESKTENPLYETLL